MKNSGKRAESSWPTQGEKARHEDGTVHQLAPGGEQGDRSRGGWRGREYGERGEGGRGEYRGGRGRGDWRGRNEGYRGGEHRGRGEGRGGGGKLFSKNVSCLACLLCL